MAKPNVNIGFENGNLGVVATSPDGICAIVASAVAAGTFALNTVYTVFSLKEAEALGIIGGITNYEFWDSVYLPTVAESINEAHKQIVRYAKIAEFPDVMIAEDDFVGTHPDSFKYFLANRPRTYDMYLSMVYIGELSENNKV